MILGGCANAIDNTKKANTSVTDLKSAIAADVELEAALLHSTARNSNEMAFVSLNTYTCGDPSDPRVRMATTLQWTDAQIAAEKKKWAEKKKNQEDKLRKQFAALDVILKYGKTLSDMTKFFANIEASAKSLDGAIETYKRYAAGEMLLEISAFQAVVHTVQAARIGAYSVSATAIALKMEQPLIKAEAAMAKGGALRNMSADELLAFRLWDDCSRERLRFYRNYYVKVHDSLTRQKVPPQGISTPDYMRQNLSGINRSDVLLLAKEYQDYLDDREAMLAKRPDYGSLIHAIVEANSAIAHPKEGQNLAGFFDDAAFWGKTAGEINDASEKARAALNKLDVN